MVTETAEENANQTTILVTQSDSFWNAVQVYPDLVRENRGPKDYYRQAFTQLRKIGITNLRFLLNRLHVSCPEKCNTDCAANLLLAADTDGVIKLLVELLKGRGKAIQEEYHSITHSDQASIQAELQHLNPKRRQSLKTLSMLIILYHRSPESVYRIFVRALWRRKTTCEFRSQKTFSTTNIEKVSGNLNLLTERLKPIFDGLALRTFDHIRLNNWTIFVLQREYSAVVRPDFRENSVTHYGLGWILLGVENSKRRVLLKGGGQSIVPEVERWFNETVDNELQSMVHDAFSEYDPKEVEDSFLGAKAESPSIFLTNACFRRSLLPYHSPITVSGSFAGVSIHQDLNYSREKEVLRLRGLSDLISFRVCHNGNDAHVQVDIEPGGGVVLRLDDTDLDDQNRESLYQEFYKHFKIPLDRRINPSHLSMGSVDIVNYLLECDNRDSDVLEYQVNTLEVLLSENVLKMTLDSYWTCPKNRPFCKKAGIPVEKSVIQCPECSSLLEKRIIRKLEPNNQKIREISRPLLEEASEWQLDTTAIQFEKEDFYKLYDPARPESHIRVYFCKKLSKRLLDCLDRSLQPVLVVHTGGDVKDAHLDNSGVAHVSFARAFVAKNDEEEKELFVNDVKQARSDLIRLKNAKVYSMANSARNRIADPPTEYDGSDYESDVFKVLRGIFPYSEYWTGNDRPDGFCSVISYEDNSLRSPKKFNWSYDAKYTKRSTHYDIDVDEKRKAWDYIAALVKQPELLANGNKLDGHAIISNKLSVTQMRDLTSFIRLEHRLDQEHPGLKVMFINDEFLISLHDLFWENQQEIRTRLPFLSVRFTQLMTEVGDDGYIYLASPQADELISEVLDMPAIDTPPDISKLKKTLNKTHKK